MTFAEALVVEAVMRQNRGAKSVFPRGRPFPKGLAHPSAIALITEPEHSRILVDSARRIPAGLKIKGGFSKLREYYAEMIMGMQKAHKGQPLCVEIWSFEEGGREDIAEKMGKQFDISFRWLGPDEIRSEMKELRGKISPEDSDQENLEAVIALLSGLD
jgi:hypothetical protein